MTAMQRSALFTMAAVEIVFGLGMHEHVNPDSDPVIATMCLLILLAVIGLTYAFVRSKSDKDLSTRDFLLK